MELVTNVLSAITGGAIEGSERGVSAESHLQKESLFLRIADLSIFCSTPCIYVINIFSIASLSALSSLLFVAAF